MKINYKFRGDIMRSNIKKVFWFYFLLFSILIIYLLSFTFHINKNITENPYNPRINTSENSTKRQPKTTIFHSQYQKKETHMIML